MKNNIKNTHDPALTNLNNLPYLPQICSFLLRKINITDTVYPTSFLFLE